MAPLNRANSMVEEDSDSKLTIGGYGQIDFNKPVEKETFQNGTLDVHRFVLLFAYSLSDRLKMVSEIEIEHVNEVYVEQAFLNYRLTDFMNLRGGLMLIPMGIVNEYHEPPTFNGVERPNVDKFLVPSTWREIGAGISGNITAASIRYQAYLVNGFNGYDGVAKFNGKNGLRGGRQKAAESYLSSPNYAFKLDYFGIRGLKIGLSSYFGSSQSVLYDGLDKDDENALLTADSSVINTAMLGVDLRYNIGGFQTRSQLIYNSINNVEEYNTFTGSDVGSSMLGYYIEAGYDLMHHFSSSSGKLVPFIRFEKYDTHHSVSSTISRNNAYGRTDITIGLGFWFTEGAVVKGDYQLLRDDSGNEKGQMNLGIGFMF
jgi:hypothetical protein